MPLIVAALIKAATVSETRKEDRHMDAMGNSTHVLVEWKWSDFSQREQELHLCKKFLFEAPSRSVERRAWMDYAKQLAHMTDSEYSAVYGG